MFFSASKETSVAEWQGVLPKDGCYIHPTPQEELLPGLLSSNLGGPVCLPGTTERSRRIMCYVSGPDLKKLAVSTICLLERCLLEPATILRGSPRYPTKTEHMERPRVCFLTDSPSELLANSQHQFHTCA